MMAGTGYNLKRDISARLFDGKQAVKGVCTRLLTIFDRVSGLIKLFIVAQQHLCPIKNLQN